MDTFTHLIFWNNKLASLTFFSLAMAMLSLWVKKSAWIWGAFLIIAIVIAFEANIVSWMALIPIGILFFGQYFMTKEIGRATRFMLFGIIVITALALSFHFLPGFNNWKIASLQLSADALPYQFYFNFDKPFTGIFVLALSLPLLRDRERVYRMLKVTLPYTFVGILVMVGISLQIRMIAWDPKLPSILLPWLFANLFFVSIPEEALFRGFIQRELFLWFGKSLPSAVGSIVITSIFFTLLHLIWVGSYPFLALVFITSVIYGSLYQITQCIESSIICHFLFNVTHFLLFTYPALK